MVIMGLVMILVVFGLDKGICILFEFNLGLVLLFLVLVLCLGLIVFLLKLFVENMGGYFLELVSKMFNFYVYEFKLSNWLGGWILLYWGWWFLWLLFVGMFIVWVFCGWIICEFVIGVLFVFVGFMLMWMMVFGNSVIYFIMN